MGALLPASGGDYAFFLAAGRPYGKYGDVPAFLVAWTSFFLDPAYMSVKGLTFSAYMLSLPYPNCAPPYQLLVLVASLFIRGNHIFDSKASDTPPSPGDIASALYSAIYSYMGWTCINYIAEEIKNPGRNIPIAIAVSTAIVLVTYLLTNLAFFVVLDADTITSTDVVAVTFVRATWGQGMANVMPLIIALTVFGSTCVSVLISSRIVFAASRQGHLARVMSYVHVHKAVPLLAVVARCSLSVAFALTGSVHFLIEASILMSNVKEAASVVTLFLLRRSMPDAPRPYRVPTAVAILRLVVCFALATVTLVQVRRGKRSDAVVGETHAQGKMYKKKGPPHGEPGNQVEAKHRALGDRERLAAKEQDPCCSVSSEEGPERQRRLALRRDVGLLSSITFLLSATIGGLCAAEMGALLPASGGDYAFFLAAGRPYGKYGDVPAFLVAWTSFFVDPAYMRSNHIFDSKPSDPPPSPGDIASALYSAIYSYMGWTSINYIAEEIKNPGRNIPIAIAVSTAIVLVTYLLTNLAFFVVLDADTITSTDVVAVTFVRATWGQGMANVMPLIIALTVFGSTCVSVLVSSRIIFAASRQGHLARVMSYVHVHRAVPLLAVVARCSLSVAFALTGSVHFLIEASILMSNVKEAASVVTLFLLRRSMPDAPRPYRVPTAVAILRLVVCFALATVTLVPGTGILITPGSVLRNSKYISIDLLMWTIGGLNAFVGALCAAELGSLLPTSGGDYAFFLAAGRPYGKYGDVPAFLAAWTSFFVDPAFMSVQGLTFSAYVLSLPYPNCNPPDELLVLVACLFITLATAVNCFSVKTSAKVLDIFSGLKCLFLYAVIITGAIYSFHGNHIFDSQPSGSPPSAGDIASALYSAIYCYMGWTCINYIAEEIKNPARNIPIAIAVSTAIVLVTYLLTNLAFFVVLDADTITSTDVVAVAFVRATWGQGMATIMPLIIALTVFGTTCVCVLVSSRILFAASRQGHLARVMSYVHVHNAVPLLAVVARCLLAVAFALTGSVHFLIEASILLNNVREAASVVTLFLLRRSMPDAPRPYRVPTAVAVLRLFVCFALATVTLVQVRRYAYQYALLAVAFATGVVYYYFCVRNNLRLRGCEKLAVFLQKCFKSAPCSKELGCQEVYVGEST
ncbi:hypothetical protein MTO96_048875 [Rhipicephalus appendiculatus]